MRSACAFQVRPHHRDTLHEHRSCVTQFGGDPASGFDGSRRGRAVSGQQRREKSCGLRITDTRSLHKDTVWVTLSIAVGCNDPITEVTKIGDRDAGTFPVRCHVSADILEDVDVPVMFSYIIVYNGNKDSSKLENGLKNAVSTLGNEAAKAATTAAGGAVGAAIDASLVLR
jgi:hypothetical protein